MALPEPFTTASPALVNFSRTDIQSGVGYVDYFLIQSQTDAAFDYHLTPNKDYSNNEALSANQSTNDNDFDLSPFVIPQTIDGTALISLAVESTINNSPVFTCELYRVRGGAETQIGSTVVFEPTLTTAKMLYMPIVITNEVFQAQDTLRLRVVQANAGSITSFMGIDPANRSHGSLTITTTSKISVPFKLDL